MGRVNPVLEQASRTKQLHLAMMDLSDIPSPVLQLTGLVRLDLGFNLLTHVPEGISSLVNLDQLWLNNNPIREVHPNLGQLKRLQVLDLRETLVKTLPRELGRLKNLFQLELEGSPLDGKMKGYQSDTQGLVAYLDNKDRRTALKAELQEKLSTGLYRETAGSEEGKRLLPKLIKAVCHKFKDLTDLRQVVRHCDRLFPKDLRQATHPHKAAAHLKEEFVALRRQNERTKLSAELEIKMRAIYYDRINPQDVEGYIRAIYQAVPLLEDVQFLIKHAARALPQEAKEITGPGVQRRMVALQEEMTEARQRCVFGLYKALTGLYSDREPVQVEEAAKKVAQEFEHDRFADKKELDDLKSLAADAHLFFPAEFDAIRPAKVKSRFRQKHNAANTTELPAN